VLYATLKRPAVVTIVRRYGLLIPTGMLLQWLFTSHVPFDWGVLQALGVGVVISTLVSMVVQSPTAMTVISGAALLAGPITERFAEQHLTGRPADVLGGIFPIVTYTGFALAGATAGLLLLRNPDRGRQALLLGAALSVVTLAMIELGMPPDRYPSGAAFIIPGLAGTLLLFGALDRWTGVPDALGTHTLGIFLTHYVVSWTITQYGWRGSLSQPMALLVALGFTALFALVAPRVPPLPWSPRTGWARGRKRPAFAQKRLASSAA
jgi:hypothetical protein